MFSKFDANIQCDETTAYEPTSADWAEYSEWVQEIEAAEDQAEPIDEFELEFDGEFDDDLELDDYGVEFPSEPWDDDYSGDDPVDMYAAEWENYALRDWD